MGEPGVELVLVDGGGPVGFIWSAQAGQGGGDSVFEFDAVLIGDVGVVVELCPPGWGVVEGVEFPDGEYAEDDHQCHRAEVCEGDSVSWFGGFGFSGRGHWRHYRKTARRNRAVVDEYLISGTNRWINASRTGSGREHRAGHTSCVRPCGRRGSGTRHRGGRARSLGRIRPRPGRFRGGRLGLDPCSRRHGSER